MGTPKGSPERDPDRRQMDERLIRNGPARTFPCPDCARFSVRQLYGQTVPKEQRKIGTRSPPVRSKEFADSNS
jgi:hypothetical protein